MAFYKIRYDVKNMCYNVFVDDVYEGSVDTYKAAQEMGRLIKEIKENEENEKTN